MNIAIITARGGSKRIPKKNIKEFCGRPIIEYSIDAALRSELFDEVMVSTDDKEIAEVAIRCGANVPFYRSEKTSDDYASTKDVLLEVIREYQNMGKDYEYMACIYPTAPFVTSKKLNEAFNMMVEREANMVIPVVKFSFPPQRAYVIDDNCLKYKWEENRDKRSQDLESFYHDAGQFYFFEMNKYIEDEGVIIDNVVPLLLSETEVQDIDNESDWLIAEMKYNLMKERNTL